MGRWEKRVVVGLFVLALVILASAAFAADADPNGFQGHYKKVQESCYSDVLQFNGWTSQE